MANEPDDLDALFGDLQSSAPPEIPALKSQVSPLAALPPFPPGGTLVAPPKQPADDALAAEEPAVTGKGEGGAHIAEPAGGGGGNSSATDAGNRGPPPESGDAATSASGGAADTLANVDAVTQGWCEGEEQASMPPGIAGEEQVGQIIHVEGYQPSGRPGPAEESAKLLPVPTQLNVAEHATQQFSPLPAPPPLPPAPVPSLPPRPAPLPAPPPPVLEEPPAILEVHQDSDEEKVIQGSPGIGGEQRADKPNADNDDDSGCAGRADSVPTADLAGSQEPAANSVIVVGDSGTGSEEEGAGKSPVCGDTGVSTPPPPMSSMDSVLTHLLESTETEFRSVVAAADVEGGVDAPAASPEQPCTALVEGAVEEAAAVADSPQLPRTARSRSCSPPSPLRDAASGVVCRQRGGRSRSPSLVGSRSRSPQPCPVETQSQSPSHARVSSPPSVRPLQADGDDDAERSTEAGSPDRPPATAQATELALQSSATGASGAGEGGPVTAQEGGGSTAPLATLLASSDKLAGGFDTPRSDNSLRTESLDDPALKTAPPDEAAAGGADAFGEKAMCFEPPPRPVQSARGDSVEDEPSSPRDASTAGAEPEELDMPQEQQQKPDLAPPVETGSPDLTRLSTMLDDSDVQHQAQPDLELPVEEDQGSDSKAYRVENPDLKGCVAMLDKSDSDMQRQQDVEPPGARAKSPGRPPSESKLQHACAGDAWELESHDSGLEEDTTRHAEASRGDSDPTRGDGAVKLRETMSSVGDALEGPDLINRDGSVTRSGEDSDSEVSVLGARSPFRDKDSMSMRSASFPQELDMPQEEQQKPDPAPPVETGSPDLTRLSTMLDDSDVEPQAQPDPELPVEEDQGSDSKAPRAENLDLKGCAAMLDKSDIDMQRQQDLEPPGARAKSPGRPPSQHTRAGDAWELESHDSGVEEDTAGHTEASKGDSDPARGDGAFKLGETMSSVGDALDGPDLIKRDGSVTRSGEDSDSEVSVAGVLSPVRDKDSMSMRSVSSPQEAKVGVLKEVDTQDVAEEMSCKEERQDTTKTISSEPGELDRSPQKHQPNDELEDLRLQLQLAQSRLKEEAASAQALREQLSASEDDTQKAEAAAHHRAELQWHKSELDALRRELEERGTEEEMQKHELARLRSELTKSRDTSMVLKTRRLDSFNEDEDEEPPQLEDALLELSSPPAPPSPRRAGNKPCGHGLRAAAAGAGPLAPDIGEPPVTSGGSHRPRARGVLVASQPVEVTPPPPAVLRYFRECSKDEATLQASIAAGEQPRRGDPLRCDAQLVWLGSSPPLDESEAFSKTGRGNNGATGHHWTERPLRLMVFTWNMGNRAPNEAELKFMVPEHGRNLDIVAFGVQEASYSGCGVSSKPKDAPKGVCLPVRPGGSPWSPKRRSRTFPDYLGPFGVLRCTNLPEVNPSMIDEGSRTYSLAPCGTAVARLCEAGIRCSGMLSDFFDVSKSAPWRDACAGFEIPREAITCAWAHPMDALRGDFAQAGLTPSVKAELEEDPDCALLFHGGLLYFDSDEVCLAALALCPGDWLCFEQPVLEPCDKKGGLVEELKAAGAFQLVTKAALREAGAEAFAWIPPGHQLEGGAPCKWGGFVYLLADSQQPARCFLLREGAAAGDRSGIEDDLLSCSDDEDWHHDSFHNGNSGGPQHQFFQLLAQRLGKEWRLVEDAHLMEMHLAIFVRSELDVSRVEKSWAATGVGKVVGNKGGLVICMNVQDNSFCFISSHLAAHSRNVQRRSEDCQQILRQARVRYKVLDAASQFDHCFWFGDLNYRVDVSGSAPKEEDPESVRQVLGFLEQELFGEVFEHDQLKIARQKGKVFAGFEEGEPSFAPTFKVERKPGLLYTQQRVPSYCDRILWRSLPHCSGGVRQTRLSGIAEVSSSDHKPVCAHFEVAPSSCPNDSMLLRLEEMSEAVAIYFVRLEAEGLRGCDLSGRSDPYIVFHSVPAALVGRCDPSSRQTRVKVQTLRPHWSPGDVPVLRAAVPANGTVPTLLRHCTLAMDLYDHDLFKGDDPMGTALISLAPTEKAGAGSTRYYVDFKAPVILTNERCGEVSGRLLVCFGPEDALRANAGSHHPNVAKKCTCTLQ